MQSIASTPVTERIFVFGIPVLCNVTSADRRPAVYLMVNDVTGDKYVGSGVDVRRRCRGHVSDCNKQRHPNPRIQRAFNKYGESAFKFYVLEWVTDNTKITETEQRWIDCLNAAKSRDFYNMLPKAYTHLGRKRSMETVRRLREARKSQPPVSDDTRTKMRLSALGRKATMATRLKISSALKGHKGVEWSEEQKQAYRKLSLEQVVKLRALRRAGWSYKQLIAEFGLSQTRIADIVTGKTYVGVGE